MFAAFFNFAAISIMCKKCGTIQDVSIFTVILCLSQNLQRKNKKNLNNEEMLKKLDKKTREN